MKISGHVDFSYLEKYGSRKKYQIPTHFSKCNFIKGQSFEARITHVYDPSKFWMVIKHRELEIFQKCLFRFYYMNRFNYKIPQKKITLEMYCVAFADNAYYRGVVVGFPDIQQPKPVAQIYFIDYGMMGCTELTNLFYMAEKFIEVPQFAVRTSLAKTCPVKNCNWTREESVKFHELVFDKVLAGVVVNVDSVKEVLQVHLSQQSPNVFPIHELLINGQHARHFHDKEHANEEQLHYESKMKYPYLFPSHEVLESGKLPCTTSDAEYQLQVAPLSSVLSRYYKRSCSTASESNSNSDK